MHVATRRNAIAKSLCFTCGQPFKANGRGCRNEHNQLGVRDQRFSPHHARTGQHPSSVTKCLLHH